MTPISIYRELARAAALSIVFIGCPVQAEGGATAIPLEVVANTRTVESRSFQQFSSDGKWIAFTYQEAPKDLQPRFGVSYSATGVPGTEGIGLRRIQLINVSTGQLVELGSGSYSSWGPSWAPNKSHLAYYSDKGGEPGIWLWDAGSGVSKRVGNAIARPFFSYEIPRWSSDGRFLVTKILPSGMTIDEANQRLPAANNLKRPFPEARQNGPSVVVLSSERNLVGPTLTSVEAAVARSTADLALINLETGDINRIVVDQPIGNYQLSPDQRHVAYRVPRGFVPNSQIPMSDLRVVTLAEDNDRLLKGGIQGGYGNEFSWSPNSNFIAFLSADGHDRRLSVVGLDGKNIEFDQSLAAVNDSDNRADVPLWDEHGRSVYVLSVNALWRFDPASAKGAEVARFPTIRPIGLISKADSNVLWQEKNHAWVFARSTTTSEGLIARANLQSGQVDIAMHGRSRYITPGRGDVTSSGYISYISGDYQHLDDIWTFDIHNRGSRQVSRINSPLEKYGAGETRQITWCSGYGQKLSGALLLPATYLPGMKLPLIVWVYPGERVAANLGRYGVGWGRSPVFNFQVLTSRGYAVFVPDIPVRPGELMKDIQAAVMPGIDALVSLGYGDPNRLAVMGQSFGSFGVWALLVQTNRFKAAITTGNVLHPDLFATYLSMSPADGSATRIGLLENGQVGMGGDPWTFQESYLKNSPVLLLDKVSTPLLMAQGSQDGDLRGADAMFVALRRLGKAVEYRVYEYESHVIQSKTDVIDFWRRRLSFLREHLGVPSAAD